MKKTILILLLFITVKIIAQNPLPLDVSVPDYNGDVVAYDTVSHKTTKLEKQKGAYSVSSKAFSSTNVGRSIDGEKSPVRIHGGQYVRFFMKWQGAMGMDIDPSTVVGMGKFEVKKGKRSILIQSAKSGFMSFKSESNSREEYKIGIDFRKMEKDVVEIILTGSLPEGEYFFGTDRSVNLICFGVDEVSMR
jgi:hypothetical protein